MSLLVERLKRLRWLAVPIAAYLVVTLVLPAANGAVRHGEFVRHAGWVVAGCAAIVALALAGSLAAHLTARGVRRVLGPRELARAANRSALHRVVSTGGPP